MYQNSKTLVESGQPGARHPGYTWSYTDMTMTSLCRWFSGDARCGVLLRGAEARLDLCGRGDRHRPVGTDIGPVHHRHFQCHLARLRGMGRLPRRLRLDQGADGLPGGE
eukprot:6204771-Pleurochrysis_carterae.AAC.2